MSTEAGTEPGVAVVSSDAVQGRVAAPETTPAAPGRLASLDAYRGLVMLLVASESFGIPGVAQSFPNSPVWQFLAYQTDHVAWIGCSLWDLIQPSFMFMVGVAIPFSLASRAAKGQTYGQMFRHALFRSLALILLGIFLRSDGHRQTNFTFEDVLTQIGLGYTFLFLLWRKPPRFQLAAAISILAVYWLANVLYPAPGPGFDYARVGVPADWHHLRGIGAHFDKNTNLAAAFDQWFLNLLPRPKPFVYNGGGYQTLNFIPSLATMIFGLLAGGLLRSQRPPERKVRTLVRAGLLCLAAGYALGLLGFCPVVKRIWTPSWAIFAAGWTCLLLAAFYAIIDMKGRKRWAFPLVVVGMNSIAMYVMAHIFPDLISRSLKTNLGQHVFEVFGAVYAPIVESSSVLFVLWLWCYWMYRRKLFLRI